MFAYHPEERKFMLYGESDGLLKNEYLQKPKLLSNARRVYMGGVNGLLCISAAADELRLDDEKEADVVLLDFSAGGENLMGRVKNEKFRCRGIVVTSGCAFWWKATIFCVLVFFITHLTIVRKMLSRVTILN